MNNKKTKPSKERLEELFLLYKQSVPYKINPNSFMNWLKEEHDIHIDRKTIKVKLEHYFENEGTELTPVVRDSNKAPIELKNVLSMIEVNINNPAALLQMGKRIQKELELFFHLAKKKETMEYEKRHLEKKYEKLMKSLEEEKKLKDTFRAKAEHYLKQYQEIIIISANSLYYNETENVIHKLEPAATNLFPPKLKLMEPNKQLEERTDSGRKVSMAFINKYASEQHHYVEETRNNENDTNEEKIQGKLQLLGGGLNEINLFSVSGITEDLELQAVMLYLNVAEIRSMISKSYDSTHIEIGLERLLRHSGNFPVILHSVIHPFNLANLVNTKLANSSTQYLKWQIDIADRLYGASQLVVHPGSYIQGDVSRGIKQIIKKINEVVTNNQKVEIALETMAGKGTELGASFDQLAAILDGVTLNDKISICFDTCHVWDAGYDIKKSMDEVLTQFDKIIGLQRIKILHINDSKNELGSKKDRHANIGCGKIGFEALSRICKIPEFNLIPKILETPSIGGKLPYKVEKKILEEVVLPSFWQETVERGILFES